MAAGCLLFLGFQKRASIEKLLGKVPPLLVLTLIVAIMYLPMSWATVSTVLVVALTLVLIASLKKETTAYKFFTNPKIVYIGLISYSLYLWHWSVLSISRWTVGIHWWSVPFQVALMFGFAIASYRYIETPLRKGHWFGKRWKTLVLGGGVIVILSGGVFALKESLKEKIYLGKESKCIPYQYETCSSAENPHPAVTPFITGTKIQRKECFLYKGSISNEVMDLCSIIPENKTLPTIFVVGSSYLHHLSPVFEELRKEFGIGISMITVPGCDLEPLICRGKNKKRITYIKKNAKEGDILFMGVTYPKRFDESSVKKITKIVNNKKMYVVHLTPIPVWERLAPAMDNICQDKAEIQWYRPKGIKYCSTYSEISRNFYNKKFNKILESLKIIEQSHPKFHVFPIHETLCDSSKCPSHINGIRLYRDNLGHISIYAAKKDLSSELRSFFIKRNLLKKKNPI